jgi:RNA polymerase sigma factor (sigma-70 family)
MEEMDRGYYFLSSTAMEIWQKDDGGGQQKMFTWLSVTHKEPWFRRVIYSSSDISGSELRDLAENVFLGTWETFNRNGKAGKLRFDKPEYTSYLFTAFKGNYLKSLQKELMRVKAEREFGRMLVTGGQEQGVLQDAPLWDGIASGEAAFSARTRKALELLSPDCRQLLLWKHVEGLSHDEIAQRKNISRSSSIKMVSRCGRRFWEIWRELTG